MEIQVEGGAPVRPGACRVIAEAGVNHNNSLEEAFKLVRLAADAGAWAIKFQLYKADTISIVDSPIYWDDSKGRKTQHEMFSTCDKFNYSWYSQVAEYCQRMGIIFFATPFDDEAVNVLENIGTAIYKIASADITNKLLLEKVAATGKPILLSTGASTIDEVKSAIEWTGYGPDKIVPLVCTLTYPTPELDANFARIETLRRELPEFMVGASDHTRGHDGGWLAASLGAVVIEKHYTTDQSQTFVPDHAFSLEPSHLADLVQACNKAATLRGDSKFEPVESELAARKMARRSLVAAKAISAGSVVTRDDFDAKRPGLGISPANVDDLIGKTLTIDVPSDHVFKTEDFA